MSLKLVIRQEVFQKVMHWVNKADFEVSGFGIVKIIDGQPTVTEAMLIEQEGSAAETEMKAEAINRAEFQLRGADGEMKWWWHSHVNMGVFWSGTDQATIKQLGTHGWFFHTVFNKKWERKSAFSCPQRVDAPFYPDTYLYVNEDIPTEVESSVTEEQRAEYNAQYLERVKEKKWGYKGRGGDSYGTADYYKGKTYNPSTRQWEETDKSPLAEGAEYAEGVVGIGRGGDSDEKKN